MALTPRSAELTRLAAGWITKTAILASSSYLLSNFAVGSDQKTDQQILIAWNAPTNKSTPPKRAVYDQMVSGIQRGQGFYDLSLNLSVLTFSMYTIFYGYYADPDQSEPMTVLIYDQRNVVRCFNGYMIPFNVWSPSAEPIQGGWSNIVVPFTGCTEITS